MPKFSVKKPFTVLVGVIVALILGVVSLMKMQLDLLPEISLPYLMVITTYPGASAEKVEKEICEPMEASLGVITGVENVGSVCAENYGIVQLEFRDDVNIDSAMVKVSAALNTLESVLPDDCGTPTIMELSADMLASMYLAVGVDGMEIEELSQYVEDEIVPSFERLDGVASVSSLGLVEKTIQIELDEKKVDALNDKILALADDKFAEAVEQLDEAKKQLEDSEKTIGDSKKKLVDSQKELNDGRQELIDGQKELDDGKKELADGKNELENGKKQLEEGKKELEEKKSETEAKLAKTETELLSAKTKLEANKAHIEAELAVLEATKSGYEDGISKIESGISAIEALMGGLSLVPDTSLPIDADTAAAINTAAGTTVAVEGVTTYAEAIGALSAVKTGLEAKKTELESSMGAQVAASQVMIDQYKEALKPIDENLKKVDDGLAQLYAGNLEAAIQLANAQTAMIMGEAQLSSVEATLKASEKQLESAQDTIDSGWKSLEDGQKQINEGWNSLRDGEKQIADGWTEYEKGIRQYEKQKKEALKKANANDLLSLQTLATLMYAQNFAMPAGYVDDVNDNSWLIEVGDNFKSIEELEQSVLVNLNDIGDVRLCDVANLTIIDNSLDSYVRLDGNQAVILSIFKSSTTGTNELSKTCKARIETLMEEHPGLHISVQMDQGEYIDLIVKSVLQSMVLGSILAIIILAIFLKDAKPTFVVAISIPLSVLIALICMYFAKVSLNMLSLSGLALGIGMLVDNSVVVIENIYRLRVRGVEAPRAAVQGTKQVAGAIIASTITSVCVFLPMIYTTGIVNELMMPMCLAIVFTLLASLLIAMTVVPAAGSTILRNAKQKEHKLFDKILVGYEGILRFCLKIKIVPILVSLVLLVISVLAVIKMGIVMIPEMTANQIQASLSIENEELNREECYAIADQAMEAALSVKGVGSIAILDGSGNQIISGFGGGGNNFRSYSFMILTENPKAGEEEVNRITNEMVEKVSAIENAEFTVSDAMGDMSQLFGSGLSINIYGTDTQEMLEASYMVMDEVAKIEGFTEISNGEEDADKVIHLAIDKNKAMSMGLSVAQIYQDIATKLTTSADSVKVTIDGIDMQITIVNELEPLNRENLMNREFTVDVVDEDGDSVTEEHKLSEFATEVIRDGVSTIRRENQARYITVSASVEDGYNTTLLSRELQPRLEKLKLPGNTSLNLGGEADTVNEMVKQMGLVVLLGGAFIYLVMVAQFQSLLSPFIVLFTVPLAFTGGLFSLLLTHENLSALSMMGFVVLMGTVVNNGIVFVDYTNQLRKGGMDRVNALIATGKTRMRPILMTALTTILAEAYLITGDDMGSQMGRGMALVIAGGLSYATLMTLFIIPVMYDIMFKKQPLDIDTGSEDLDDIPDDAAEYMAELGLQAAAVGVAVAADSDKPKKKRKKFGKKKNEDASTNDGLEESNNEKSDDSKDESAEESKDEKSADSKGENEEESLEDMDLEILE